jgi:hypothetical protein
MITNNVRCRIWRRKKMKNKIIGIYVCVLMIVATFIPIGTTIEKSNPTPLVATGLSVPGSYEQGCFNISWPTYDKWVRFRFPVEISEICNETHTNVTVNITITNNGPARLCSVPPMRPRLNPGESRSYEYVISTFPAGGTKTLKSSILFGWGYPYINITVTVDDCPPVIQTARVLGHFIKIA